MLFNGNIVYLSNAALGLLDKIDKHDDILMPFCDLDGKRAFFVILIILINARLFNIHKRELTGTLKHHRLICVYGTFHLQSLLTKP